MVGSIEVDALLGLSEGGIEGMRLGLGVRERLFGRPVGCTVEETSFTVGEEVGDKLGGRLGDLVGCNVVGPRVGCTVGGAEMGQVELPKKVAVIHGSHVASESTCRPLGLANV